MGRLIMTKSRAIRLAAPFPNALWKEIINAAVYLHNRSPRELVKGCQETYIDCMNKEDSMEKERTNNKIERDEGVFMYIMPRSDFGNHDQFIKGTQ